MRLHIHDADYAPAQLQPVGEIGVVVRRTRPDQRLVAHLARARQTPGVAVLHDAAHLAVGLYEPVIHAAVQVEGVHPVQPRRRPRDLRVLRPVYLPQVEMEARDLVVVLHALIKCVPVELLPRLLLDEFDAAHDLLDRVVLRVDIVVVSQRYAQLVGRQLEISVLILARHNAAVAGHVAGDEAFAEYRVVPFYGDARLSRRQRADVGGYAVVLHAVEIHRRKLLVYHRGEEDRYRLHRKPDKIREAGHYLRRHQLVKADYPVRERLFAADGHVRVEHCADDIRRMLDYHVVQQMAGAELHAAVALKLAVNEGRNGEIRRHPAVFPQPFHDLKRAFQHEGYHVLPCREPPAEIVQRVPQAAPFAGLAQAAHGLICIAEAGFPLRHYKPSFAIFIFFISRLSTNA